MISFLKRFIPNIFLDPFKGVKGIDGKKLIADKKKPTYVIAMRVLDKKRGRYYSQRIGTQSFDSLRVFVTKKVKRDDGIYYIAARRGKKRKDIKAIAIYSERLGEVVCNREMALLRIRNL